MKISMVVLNPFTHDSRVLKEAESLIRQGHQVTVNALWKQGLAFKEQRSGIQIVRTRQHARELVHIPGLAWLELLLAIPNKIAFQRPEVIHAHDLNALILAYPAARLSRARIIYDAHELETARNFGGAEVSGWRKRLMVTVERFLIRRVDAVITVSPSIARHLEMLYQIPIPFIVLNCPLLSDIPPKGQLRSQIGLAAGKPLLLYQGGILAGRGLPTLLEAVALLPEITLVILGDGPILGSVKEKAHRLGIEERVHFLGAVPYQELLKYTCDADMGTCLLDHICLNHYYALPNKLFEYLMVGVPVLASDFPDLRQVILESKAGKVTDPADPVGIASAIREMLADRKELAAMGVHARQIAISKYNWQVEESILIEAYQKALGNFP